MIEYAVENLHEADRIIASRGGSKDEAEDASQQAIVKLLTAQPSGVRNKPAYWIRSVINTWLSEKRRKRTVPFSDMEAFDPSAAGDSFADHDALADVAQVLSHETPAVRLAVKKMLAGTDRMNAADRINLYRFRKRLRRMIYG